MSSLCFPNATSLFKGSEEEAMNWWLRSLVVNHAVIAGLLPFFWLRNCRKEELRFGSCKVLGFVFVLFFFSGTKQQVSFLIVAGCAGNVWKFGISWQIRFGVVRLWVSFFVPLPFLGFQMADVTLLIFPFLLHISNCCWLYCK